LNKVVWFTYFKKIWALHIKDPKRYYVNMGSPKKSNHLHYSFRNAWHSFLLCFCIGNQLRASILPLELWPQSRNAIFFLIIYICLLPMKAKYIYRIFGSFISFACIPKFFRHKHCNVLLMFKLDFSLRWLSKELTCFLSL
jgi:hypothetical protein